MLRRAKSAWEKLGLLNSADSGLHIFRGGGRGGSGQVIDWIGALDFKVLCGFSE